MKLTDIVDRIKGNVDRFTTDLEYYIGGEHMDSNELEITRRGLLKENLGKLGFKFHFAFQERDIIFMARNPHLRKAGMVMFSGLCSDASYILRSKDENIITQEFLAIQMQSDHFWDYCERTKVGSVNFANNWTSIANYKFDLPSIDKQKEISQKVWSAYRLKESYKKLLVATDEMVKSQFIEMFGYCQQLENLSSLCDTFIDGDWIESKDQSNEGIRLIQTGNVGNGFFKDKEDQCRFISNETFDKLHCTEIFPGDILVARLPDPIGRSCIIPDGLGRMITAVDCSIIRLKASILPYFFVAYTMTSTYSGQINEVTAGTTRRRVSRANLGNIKVPTPPTDQQKLFVSIAEQADKSKFVGFKSQFIEMFYNENFRCEKLKPHIEVIRGVSYKPTDVSGSVNDSSVVILRSNNIANGQINFDDIVCVDSSRVSDSQRLGYGDIVMCGSNGSKNLVGKAAMVTVNPEFKTSFGAFCLGIRCKDTIRPKFLASYFQTSIYRNIIEELGAGSNILNIKPDHISNMEIPVPSIDQQNLFVSIAEQSDKSKLI